MFNYYERLFMKRSTFLFVTVLSVLFAASAFSQTQTPVVNAREHNQQKRIEQGVKSGELTNGETQRLERQEGKIKADELNAKADGKVTKSERVKLRREQNRESSRIYRAKHNNKVRK